MGVLVFVVVRSFTECSIYMYRGRPMFHVREFESNDYSLKKCKTMYYIIFTFPPFNNPFPAIYALHLCATAAIRSTTTAMFHIIQHMIPNPQDIAEKLTIDNACRCLFRRLNYENMPYKL